VAKKVWLSEQVNNAEKQRSAYTSDAGRDMPGDGHHRMKQSESPMDMIQQLQAMAPMMQGGMPRGIGGIPGLPINNHSSPRMHHQGSMSGGPGQGLSGGPGHSHGMHPGHHP